MADLSRPIFMDDLSWFGEGAGDFSVWRSHATAMLLKYQAIMRPGKEHYVQISELIIRGCMGLVGGGAEFADRCFKRGEARGLIYLDEAYARVFPK